MALTKLLKMNMFRAKIKTIALPKWLKRTIFAQKVKAIALPKCPKMAIFRPKPKAVFQTYLFLLNSNCLNIKIHLYMKLIDIVITTSLEINGRSRSLPVQTCKFYCFDQQKFDCSCHFGRFNFDIFHYILNDY